CGAAASCLAISGTLAEQWNGSTWRTLRTLRFDSFTGISCAGRTRCIAVGSRVAASAQGLTLAEQWNGRSWGVPRSLTPARSDTLTGIAWVGPAFCVSIGPRRAGHSFAEKWNGHRWQLLQAPPKGLTSVSCPTMTKCVAVGGTASAVWNGRTWR